MSATMIKAAMCVAYGVGAGACYAHMRDECHEGEALSRRLSLGLAVVWLPAVAVANVPRLDRVEGWLLDRLS